MKTTLTEARKWYRALAEFRQSLRGLLEENARLKSENASLKHSLHTTGINLVDTMNDNALLVREIERLEIAELHAIAKEALEKKP